MKKGLLQRASKNWEEIKFVTLPDQDIKQEQDTLDRKSRPPSPHLETTLKIVSINRMEAETLPSTSSIAAIPSSPSTTPQQSSKRFQQVQSMIAVRKDYSYKYAQNKITNNCLDISSAPPQLQYHAATAIAKSLVVDEQLKKEVIVRSPLKKGPAVKIVKQSSEPVKQPSSIKPNISILERHDYNKSTPKVTAMKTVQNDDEETKPRAIEKEVTPKRMLQPKVMVENLKTNILKVPIGKMMKRAELLAAKESDQPPAKKQKKKKKKKKDRNDEDMIVDDSGEQVKVIVESTPPNPTIIKQEPGMEATSRQSTESKDSQNINKINNKINIIFQLNDNKSLRKNIILHRRAPKKMTKITIKEANNNINSNNGKTTQADSDATTVPEKSKILCTIETQTDESVMIKSSTLNMSNYPLHDDITEYMFFENDILICVNQQSISFFEYHRLSALLKKGESDFRLIDRTARRMHDFCVDNDNKFQRLCYNEDNPLPIYVEMRAKQKELDDPESCPIAFVYCNVYYIDQRGAKFSSVHLDTVKSVTSDICYTTIPNSCYFVMAWSEKSVDMKSYVTGLVKYKLTPNLDLAKLASIRQFPKVFYRIKQMYCGKDSLITNGDSQVSIFNYNNGDLLISLDLMKNYGINLTTFEFEENYLFMVYLADTEDLSPSHRRVIVIGVNKYDGNSLKVIQSTTVKIGCHEKVLSRSITSTNHLIATFSSGSALMLYLDNFRDIHFRNASNESIVVASNDYIVGTSNSNLGLAHFTEFFLD